MKSEGFKIIGMVYSQPVLFIYITHLASVSLCSVSSRPFPSIMQHVPSSLGRLRMALVGHIHPGNVWECHFPLGSQKPKRSTIGGR